ncbi:MAG: PadR family transcriptional regulator [Desulfovibrionales bacterium]|nr:PadR family transcriptional regulator [Desulfovibrionales bacterium]
MSGGKNTGTSKAERYIQPSLLMALLSGASYGYELLQRLPDFGFFREDVPPGMIYRHLRQMEEEELVISRWEAEGSGPAKRVYEVTPAGREVLEAWIGHMENRMRKLQDFVALYRSRTATHTADHCGGKDSER